MCISACRDALREGPQTECPRDRRLHIPRSSKSGTGGRKILGKHPAPTQPFESTRAYVSGTNVVETTFRTAGGEARVSDCMTLSTAGVVELASRYGLDGAFERLLRAVPKLAARQL